LVALRSLTVAVLGFAAVACLAGMLLFSDVALAFFYSVFGNQVYALTVEYYVDSTPDFRFSVARTRIPVECVLSGFSVRELGESEAANATLTLNVLVYVLNRQKQFQGSFTFNDAKPRAITVYLPHVKASDGLVTVEVSGFYNQAPLEAGAQLKLEEA